MRSDQVAKWVALGANLGVLIGLVLLIFELSQTRKMMKAQVRHELAMGIVDILQVPASNQELARALVRANAGEELTPLEMYQVRMRTNALFRYWEDVHYQYRIGLYDDAEFERQREAWRASFTRSALQKTYWCEVKSHYSESFSAEIDALFLKDDC